MAVAPVRPRVKILTVVWGDAFIARLDTFGFGSFLAPGNLPDLARKHDVEIVILTRAEDEAVFEGLPSIEKVRSHAAIRYVPIDDLIAPGQYSTTLHLAFTRGLALFGDEMLNMHFVFWNADFVLSDGAFRHLGELMAEGHKAIITGTLRSVAELSEMALRSRRHPVSHALSVTSRGLLDIAFRHMHAHHVAKTANQPVCWTSMPSQMLWRVDHETQLGRFFKAFMFCLKPTRTISSINGPCDYAFVPELCPGEPQHMIQDSDKAFILELQPRDSENEFISLAPVDEGERRSCMGEWLTAEHLDTARRTVVFRSGAGATDAALAQAQKDFKSYFDGFMADVPPPRSHRGQYYWLFGVSAWNINRENWRPGQRLPPELDLNLSLDDLRHPTNERHRARAASTDGQALARGRLRTELFGKPYAPSRLHPDAPAAAILDAIAKNVWADTGTEGRLLTVAEIGGWVAQAFPLDDPRVHPFELTPASFWPLSGPPHAQAVLIYIRPPQSLDVAGILHRVSGALADGASVRIVLHDASFKGRPAWMDEQLKASLSVLGQISDAEVTRHEATLGERRYAAAFFKALPYLADPGAPRPGLGAFPRLIGVAAAFATKQASSRPSGRSLITILSGTFRKPASGLSAALHKLPQPAPPARLAGANAPRDRRSRPT
ncbi:MAG: hypothetical protein SGJ21_14765 [Alphaproteobacteria bacterium]|nr:hypothetical protein [Alphaproteobacteria bacterium]